MLSFAGSNWAGEEGQDFIADHNSSNIDFATIHCWPDNWKVPNPSPRSLDPPNPLCHCKAQASHHCIVPTFNVAEEILSGMNTDACGRLIQVLDSEFQRTWIRMHAEHAKDVLHKPVCALHLHIKLTQTSTAAETA